jgi:enoyl-CoA hydratase/carnithine racemase
MDIITELREGVFRLQINRPEKKNALTQAMYSEMAQAFQAADRDPAVRVILVHGHPDVFTGGNDLADFMNLPPPAEGSPVLNFISAISAASKPIVAAVSGPAVGIGVTMLLHFELVYAAESTRFQLPFVNLALPPEAGSSLLLPNRIGYGRAAELLMLGEPFSAATALQCGLITATAADGEAALSAAKAAAEKLAAKPSAALRLAKRLMKQGGAEALARQVRDEMAGFDEQLRSPEAKEAMRAFFEKRPPNFAHLS